MGDRKTEGQIAKVSHVDIYLTSTAQDADTESPSEDNFVQQQIDGQRDRWTG